MQKLRTTLLSLGAAIASTKLAHMASALELDDVLRPVGLSRRRSRWPGHLAFLGAGIVVGGVGALLFAPTSGEQTRQRLTKKAGELGEAAVKRARVVCVEIRAEVGLMSPNREHGGHPSEHEQT
jgi:hypothetical protein